MDTIINEFKSIKIKNYEYNLSFKHFNFPFTPFYKL